MCRENLPQVSLSQTQVRPGLLSSVTFELNTEFEGEMKTDLKILDILDEKERHLGKRQGSPPSIS